MIKAATKHVKVSLAEACVHLADRFGYVTDAEITEASRAHVTLTPHIKTFPKTSHPLYMNPVLSKNDGLFLVFSGFIYKIIKSSESIHILSIHIFFLLKLRTLQLKKGKKKRNPISVETTT